MDKRIRDNHRRAVEVIRGTGTERGAPADLVEGIVARLRPSIRLVPQAGAEDRVGGSRIGGFPDLPEGTAWPRLDALDEDDLPPAWMFILQVDLAQTRGLDPEGVLPAEGLLSYFYYLDKEDMADGDSGGSIVRHFPPSGPPLRRVEFPADLAEDRRFHGLKLVPRPEWTVPPPADLGLEPGDFSLSPDQIALFGLWHDLESRLAQVQGVDPANRGGNVAHRLLGYPEMIQSPGLAEGTRLLLQVHSDRSSRGKGWRGRG